MARMPSPPQTERRRRSTPLREALKEKSRSLPGFPILRFIVRCLRGSQSRREALFELSGTEGVFQPYATTAFDRYPAIFRFVRDEIGDGPQRRILSFGCSSGEEVFSLRRYFPEAQIVGIDANPYNISVCRRNARQRNDHGVHFRVATTPAAEPDEMYDAIFCMAVLRHGLLTTADSRCDHLLRFADFDRITGDLARCLRPGGLLAIRHSNFRFSDASASTSFTVAHRLTGKQSSGPTPLFGPDNRRLEHGFYDEAVFRKITR